MKYGFSVAIGTQRERDYILIPGLRTSRVAPVLGITMYAPDWIKFLTSYAYQEKLDLTDPNQLNELIFNPNQGMFFQGLKWRIQDPSDAAGYGIGIGKLNDMGILATRNPERIIRDVFRNTGNLKTSMDNFMQIFNPSVVARTSVKEIRAMLTAVSVLPEPRRTYETIALTVRLIRASLKNRTPQEQNEIAATIYQFISILHLLRINPAEITQNDLASILCIQKPGRISPHLSPKDVAVVIHQFVRNADTGGLPIVLSFIVSDILGATRTNSPEQILWEANRMLPSDTRIEQYVRKLHNRIKLLINYRGFSNIISEKEFVSICSCAEIRKEAIWWEYNLILGRLEELMRDFVAPYIHNTPWSGKSRKEFSRLSKNAKWLRDATTVLQRISDLARNVTSNDLYAIVMNEEELITWFREIQPLLDHKTPIDTRFKSLWAFSERLSQLDDNPAANYDAKTDTILLHKNPSDTNPYIQRSIVWTWMDKFSRIWSAAA